MPRFTLSHNKNSDHTARVGINVMNKVKRLLLMPDKEGGTTTLYG
jgi:hypothetical protein